MCVICNSIHACVRSESPVEGLVQNKVPEEGDRSEGPPQLGLPAPVLQGDQGLRALPGHPEHPAGGEHVVVGTGPAGMHRFQVVGPGRRSGYRVHVKLALEKEWLQTNYNVIKRNIAKENLFKCSEVPDTD